MSWRTATVYGFDVESTGVDVFTDRIVTATVVKVTAGQVEDSRTWLLDPGVEIPEGATAVHGITTEQARAEGMSAAQGVAEIAATVGQVMQSGFPLVAFNAAYDLSILEVEAERHNLPSLSSRVFPDRWQMVIDPMVLGKGIDTIRDRRFVKGRKFTLPALCEWHKVPFTESHDATADAVGAALLAVKLLDSDPYLAEMGPGPLHQLQATWRREMQRSLREYFDKVGKEHDGVDGGWPLHSRLQEQAVSA